MSDQIEPIDSSLHQFSKLDPVKSGTYKLKFPKSARIRTRRQYQRISQQYTRYVGQSIIIDARFTKNSPSKPYPPRLGITVTRRYGNAVQRNRFKRLVREAFRLNYRLLPDGCDLNVKPRSAAQKSTLDHIASELIRLMKPKQVQKLISDKE